MINIEYTIKSYKNKMLENSNKVEINKPYNCRTQLSFGQFDNLRCVLKHDMLS